MSAPALLPVGARVAIPVERGGLPGVLRCIVVGYVVTATGLGVQSALDVAGWFAADPRRSEPSARVWGVLETLHGAPAGQRRADLLEGDAARCAELDALEDSVTVDLAGLEVAL